MGQRKKDKSGGFIRKISILRVKKIQIYGLSTYGLSNCECVSDIPLKILEILCDFLSFTANNMVNKLNDTLRGKG